MTRHHSSLPRCFLFFSYFTSVLLFALFFIQNQMTSWCNMAILTDIIRTSVLHGCTFSGVLKKWCEKQVACDLCGWKKKSPLREYCTNSTGVISRCFSFWLHFNTSEDEFLSIYFFKELYVMIPSESGELYGPSVVWVCWRLSALASIRIWALRCGRCDAVDGVT